MSEFKVPLTTIREILPHNNAERLEVAVVYGFQVIVSKGQYKVGDKVLYVPIDSILPQELEDKLFPPDSKVKLNKHRIRQIKLRGVASQGMLIDVGNVPANAKLEVDFARELGITKYEPPVRENTSMLPGTRKSKQNENPNFTKYGGLDNIKWYPEKFKADEEIVLQEKIHGTNARAAVMPFVANTLWKKILRFFGKAPSTEFCYGSNNVQLQNKSGNSGYYGEDVYGKCFNSINAKDKLKLGETIFGEIYGEGIQKNYSYGTKEHKFILFDVKILQPDGTHKWLNPDEVNSFAKERDFNVVPELYRGPYISLDFVKTFTKGNSVLAPTQKIREGVVVKSLSYDEFGRNRALKVISEDYLNDASNTDFH
jgi:RNA ligase (TIGR02306 family)